MRFGVKSQNYGLVCRALRFSVDPCAVPLPADAGPCGQESRVVENSGSLPAVFPSPPQCKPRQPGLCMGG
jgi:hypothetical protein